MPDGEVVGLKVQEMQSHGPGAPAECCAANSGAAVHCLLENSSGIFKAHLLFAYGAQSNETRGLGREHTKSRSQSHTYWK